MSSLFTAITGMRNHQTMLDVISNNVANVNTIGFKSGRVMFRDLLSQTIAGASGYNGSTNVGGMNPVQSGTGVAVASVDTRFTQGTLQTTGIATDMAINGDGFFITKTGTSTLYTRAGNFRFDGNGNLVDPSGGIVQGWSASLPTSTIGVVDTLGILQVDSTKTTEIGNIRIPSGSTLQAHETTQVNLVGNLDAGANAANLINSAGVDGTTQLTAYDYTPGTPNPPGPVPTAPTEGAHQYTVGQTQMAFTVYDSLGNAHQMTATLTNLSGTQIPEAALGENYDNNTWAWTVDTDQADTTVHLALDNSTYTDPITGAFVRASSSGLIHFNTNGSLDWVTYADRNAEHFGTRYDQLAANDPNIPGGNDLPTTAMMPPTAGFVNLPEGPNDTVNDPLLVQNPINTAAFNNDLWADIADLDPHNSTTIGFEGATVAAGDFRGDASASVAPFSQDSVDTVAGLPLLDGAIDNVPFDNPGVPVMLWMNEPNIGAIPGAGTGDSGSITGVVGTVAPATTPARDAFELNKNSIVLVYQNVPAGSPVPPAFDTPGRLVNLDVAGMQSSTQASPTLLAGSGVGNTINSVQQWYVQSFNIDWGTVSVITQADFDRADDAASMVSANWATGGLPTTQGQLNAPVPPDGPATGTNTEYEEAHLVSLTAYSTPVGTGDGVMDGAHLDGSNFDGTDITVPGGSGAAFGDRASDLEMPWDPRVVRTTYGLRDGLTQDATGTWNAEHTIYTPKFAARMESQDGYGEGTLSGVSVTTDGTVIGTFNTTDGSTIYQELARIAVANFTNPAGLAKAGDTHWTETSNSGSAVKGEALSQGRGAVISGVLEQSNVDLSEELTNMIVAQRGFEVNARLVTTSDRILDTLVNLAR
ncbi:MAG: flagellar hook-basal body complex protein [Candidatus Coatesbacteria bacterium]